MQVEQSQRGSSGGSVASKCGVEDVELSVVRHRAAIAAAARRIDRVEEIDTRIDRRDQIAHRADAHEVARLLCRKQRGGRARAFVHFLARFAHRQTADRVAREIELDDVARAALAQRAVESALNDRKEQGAIAGRHRSRSSRPHARQAHRLFELFARRGQLHADVENHGNVAADSLLKFNDVLGREAMLASVEVRREGDAVVVETPPALEAKDLKAARIGEDRAIPRHEAMESARRLDRRDAGTQPEMIRVGKHDLRLRLAQLRRRHAFHRRRGADRHEAGRLDVAVRQAQAAASRAAVPRYETEHATSARASRYAGGGSASNSIGSPVRGCRKASRHACSACPGSSKRGSFLP